MNILDSFLVWLFLTSAIAQMPEESLEVDNELAEWQIGALTTSIIIFLVSIIIQLGVNRYG